MTISAVDCHYSITGSGPPLFLTHGIGAAQDAWRFMLPKLSKHFSVVTYDLRGHGKSPVTHKNFTLDELVFDLERIREKTKFEKAITEMYVMVIGFRFFKNLDTAIILHILRFF